MFEDPRTKKRLLWAGPYNIYIWSMCSFATPHARVAPMGARDWRRSIIVFLRAKGGYEPVGYHNLGSCTDIFHWGVTQLCLSRPIHRTRFSHSGGGWVVAASSSLTRQNTMQCMKMCIICMIQHGDGWVIKTVNYMYRTYYNWFWTHWQAKHTILPLGGYARSLSQSIVCHTPY